eukprot:TRINITY_DN3227_c0_g2_i1.p1 TRINITY_DN3227_c0_g2~~TRINITY_DN3227_c0_g2_i1.p1  ORF type:complete len:524 (-),score=100.60 TRINITY_DN3227_c0_g2_i1:1123-2694(-)
MNATLAQKLRKVVDLRTESSDLQTALKTLSTFYASNTPQNRNNLRGEIENRGLIFSKQFLSEMQALHEKVHAIRTDVDAMAKSCDDMNQRFEKNLETTKSLIVQTDEMRKSKDQIEAQLVMADRFLSRFQLTNEEMSALRKAHIDDSFFDVMKRIQQIHHDCKVLLRTQHQRAAIDVIDFMSVQQEAAYEKLYRWVLSQSKALDRDNPEVSSQLKTATRILRDRPSHFKSCMEEISNIRKAAILRGFSNALTRGGPNGNPRPIDMHAHDPLRYIGDMLAWLHQAVASEHEVIAGLIDTTIKDLDGPVGKKPLGTEGSVMLDTIVEGVCRAFNTRLEQVIATQPSPIVTYRLSNILEFYKQTLLPILGQTSAMIFTFQEAKHTCDTLFSNLMKLQNDKLLKSPPQCPSDFSPPYILGEALESLAELMTIYETSLTAEGATDTEFQPVFRATLDPVMQACTLSATSLTPNKMAVYMINCLSAILVGRFDKNRAVRIIMYRGKVCIDIHGFISATCSHALTSFSFS